MRLVVLDEFATCTQGATCGRALPAPLAVRCPGDVYANEIHFIMVYHGAASSLHKCQKDGKGLGRGQAVYVRCTAAASHCKPTKSPEISYKSVGRRTAGH